jgi:hypothetical protein
MEWRSPESRHRRTSRAPRATCTQKMPALEGKRRRCWQHCRVTSRQSVPTTNSAHSDLRTSFGSLAKFTEASPPFAGRGLFLEIEIRERLAAPMLSARRLASFRTRWAMAGWFGCDIEGVRHDRAQLCYSLAEPFRQRVVSPSRSPFVEDGGGARRVNVSAHPLTNVVAAPADWRSSQPSAAPRPW